jgi:hypothetical protein
LTDTNPNKVTYVIVMQVLNFMETDCFSELRHEDEQAQSPVMFLLCVV